MVIYCIGQGAGYLIKLQYTYCFVGYYKPALSIVADNSLIASTWDA